MAESKILFAPQDLAGRCVEKWRAGGQVWALEGAELSRYQFAFKEAVDTLTEAREAAAKGKNRQAKAVRMIAHDNWCGFHTGLPDMVPCQDKKSNVLANALQFAIYTKEEIDRVFGPGFTDSTSPTKLPFDPAEDLIFVFKSTHDEISDQALTRTLIRDIIHTNACSPLYIQDKAEAAGVHEDDNGIYPGFTRGTRMLIFITPVGEFPKTIPELKAEIVPLPDYAALEECVKDVLEPMFEAYEESDGVKGVNTYVDGVLLTSATRGDGSEGEDVTANAIQMVGLPRKLAGKFTGQVRGEAYMLLSDLEAINKLLITEGSEPYENVRNAASGIIRSTDGRFSERLHFAAHGIDDPSGGLCIDRHHRAYNALKLLGFDVVETISCETVYQAIDYYKSVQQRRPNLGYWIDGTVFLLNDLEAFKAAGVTNKRPKGGIAFKFPAERAETKIINLTISVGHTGKIIPTAVLEPVRIGGTTVSNALLNNWEEIARLGIVCNDKVIVIKAGDIIPKVVGIAERWLDGCKNDRRSFEFIPPTKCPVCDGTVARNTNTDGSQTADLYCQNPECDAKVTGKIARWVKSLDIKGLGDEVLAALTEERTYGPTPDFIGDKSETMTIGTCGIHRIVSSVADLYTLKADVLADLMINGKKFGKKRAASILAEIDKTRILTIDQFMGSLGIKHLGKRRVQIIREAYTKAANEANQQPNSPQYDCHLLDGVDGWFTNEEGSVLTGWADKIGITNIAEAIQEELDAKECLILDLLKHIAIKALDVAPTTTASGPLSGKVLAFTGFRPDDDLTAKIKAAGGTISEDLSKSCTHLVQKDPSKESSKSKKAKGWGLAIIGPEELTKLCQGEAA